MVTTDEPNGQNPNPTPPEPSVEPSSTPDGPTVVPAPSTPEGEPGPDPSGASTQLENAETSMDEPSDNSGAE